MKAAITTTSSGFRRTAKPTTTAATPSSVSIPPYSPNPRPIVGDRSALRQQPGIGQGQETLDRDHLGAGLRVKSCRRDERLAAEDLQAGAQHLAPLAERG